MPTIGRISPMRRLACEKRPAGKELIVCSWAHGISSHNLKTGEVNWEIAGLQAAAGRVSGAGRRSDLRQLRRRGRQQYGRARLSRAKRRAKLPKVVYSKDRSIAPYVPTLCAAGDLLFLWGDKGIVSCIDADSGKCPLDATRRRQLFRLAGACRRSHLLHVTDGDMVVLASVEGVQAAGEEFARRRHPGDACDCRRADVSRTDTHLISIGGKAKKETAAAR